MNDETCLWFVSPLPSPDFFCLLLLAAEAKIEVGIFLLLVF